MGEDCYYVYESSAIRSISVPVSPVPVSQEEWRRTVVSASGRFRDLDRMGVRIDTAASRLTGASVTGLVVGAMGVFVFAVALRHWLGEHRRFREEARA
jgi:hypothetical protein